MPQSSQVKTESGRTFQVAQVRTESPAPSQKAETSKPAEETHHPGEIPHASLLLWNAVLAIIILLAWALVARNRMQKVPKGFANLTESFVEGINKLTVDTIGHGGEKYTPLVGTVFFYIFVMNLLGVIPGLHSPTANLTFTFSVSIVVFIVVQIEGIRQNGLFGYFRHFMGPSLKETSNFPHLFWLMLPVEIISEYVKPFTLAIRLFGNIFGEDVIIGVLAALAFTMPFHLPLPFQFPILILSVLTDFVQALVFAILTCIYISLVSHHGSDEHNDETADNPAHAHLGGH